MHDLYSASLRTIRRARGRRYSRQGEQLKGCRLTENKMYAQCFEGGVAALLVGHRTGGLESWPGTIAQVALDKLLTPMCLCHQPV